MVTEYDKDQFGSQGQVEYAEHSTASKAKKIVEVAPAVPAVVALGVSRWQTGVQVAVGTQLVLAKNKAYRVIASVPAYLVAWYDEGAGTPPTAAAGDFYLPANVPVIISTKEMNKLESAVVAGAGIIQAVEVL